jgi:6-pyruvoyltetrahydropterin/6-carboxytetrahydropterin synthase
MEAKVTKIMYFEMAHKLTEAYSEECKCIHGHGYKLEVTFKGPICPKTGMIVDFKQIKEVLSPIVDFYDHNYLDEKSYGVNPTAENMAFSIFEEVKKSKLSHLLHKVRLWETKDAYAEVGY